MDQEGPTPDEIERRIREREAKVERLRQSMEKEARVKRLERKETVARSAKTTAFVLAGLLVFAGAAWGYFKATDMLEESGCSFHEHATFQIVDQGEVLRFQHSRFDMKHMEMRAHLHQPDDSKVHLEGGCATVQEFFGIMDMKIRPGHLQLDTVLHDDKVLKDEGNLTLRFFLYHEVGGNWTWEEYPKLLGHQLRDGQRMLVTYGDYTDEEIARYQAGVPPVGNQQQAQPGMG
ncbi:MAG: hypothetical protein KY455_11345 [Euryarchaeota archaeon]|nr:hypothetical protein [Euryarchaeota archaeon]